MFFFLSLPVSLLVLVSTFFIEYYSFIYIILVDLFLFLMMIALKEANKNHRGSTPLFSLMSYEAQEIWNKYSHIYRQPFASRDWASIAASIMFLGVLIALILCYYGLYWGLLVALINWFFGVWLSHFFNPIQMFMKTGEIYYHDEILSHLRDQKY